MKRHNFLTFLAGAILALAALASSAQVPIYTRPAGLQSGGSFSGPLLGPDASCAAPTYSWANNATGGLANATGGWWYMCGGGSKLIALGSNGFSWNSGSVVGFAPTAEPNANCDTCFVRDTADTLAVRRGTNAQAFRLYNTFTDASNYERLAFSWSANTATIGTENLGTGAARPLALNGATTVNLQTGGATRWQVSAGGHLITAALDNTYDIGASGATRPRNVYVGGGVVGGAVPYTLDANGIPFIDISSATMGNNGAITAITALPTTYANAYILLPAGAVAAGVPAATTWYYATCSSTTACTVFNNAYAGGHPVIPGSPTAFATTGPGAFTGITAATDGPTVTVPANALGANGALRFYFNQNMNNTAGSKTVSTTFGGLSGGGAAIVSQQSFVGEYQVRNSGVTNKQSFANVLAGPGGYGQTNGAGPLFGTVDTTANVTAKFVLVKSVATDNNILEAYHFLVMPAP